MSRRPVFAVRNDVLCRSGGRTNSAPGAAALRRENGLCLLAADGGERPRYGTVVAAGLPTSADAPAFSLADAGTIRNVLTAAGFHDIAIAPFDAPVCCGDIERTLSVLLQVGALGKMLRKDPRLGAEAEPRVRNALKAHRVDGQVMLNAAT